MIEECDKDIFTLDVEAIINPVNCVGVMGAGLALQFKERYSANYKAYKTACDNKMMVPGDLFTTKVANEGIKYIINFPTKKHFQNPSRIDYINKGLIALKQFIDMYQIKTVGMPAIGCGLGGLNYNTVKKSIEKEFSNHETVIYLIKPK